MKLFVQIGAPTCITVLDVLIRSGFGLSVVDVGADLALIAVSGMMLLAIEEGSRPRQGFNRSGILLSGALVELVGWVTCLWLLSHQDSTFAATLAIVFGTTGLLWFFRECFIMAEQEELEWTP